VVPHFVPKHWWQNFLHMNTAMILRTALLRQQNIVVMEIPYHITNEEDHTGSEVSGHPKG
jgi:hypothetical protein